MKERYIQNLIRIELSNLGIMNFRNNTGMGWAGKVTKIREAGKYLCYPGDAIVRKAMPLKAGLCEGSSDIIGIKTIVITSDMVGKSIGVFVALEVKAKNGKESEKQKTFIDNINNAGGIAGIVRSVEDIEKLIK